MAQTNRRIYYPHEVLHVCSASTERSKRPAATTTILHTPGWCWYVRRLLSLPVMIIIILCAIYIYNHIKKTHEDDLSDQYCIISANRIVLTQTNKRRKTTKQNSRKKEHVEVLCCHTKTHTRTPEWQLWILYLTLYRIEEIENEREATERP